MRFSLKFCFVVVAVIAVLCFYIRVTIDGYLAEKRLARTLLGGKPIDCIEGSGGKPHVVFSDAAMPRVDPVDSIGRWIVLRLFVTDYPTAWTYLEIDTDLTFNTVTRDKHGDPKVERLSMSKLGSFSACKTLETLTIRGQITGEIIEYVSPAPQLRHIVLSGELADNYDVICDRLLECSRLETLDLTRVEGETRELIDALHRRNPSLEVIDTP